MAIANFAREANGTVRRETVRGIRRGSKGIARYARTAEHRNVKGLLLDVLF